MEYTQKTVLREEYFLTATSLGYALAMLVEHAERQRIALIGMPATTKVNGCIHSARLVECELENGTTHVNVEVDS